MILLTIRMFQMAIFAVIASIAASDEPACVNQKPDNVCNVYKNFCYFPKSSVRTDCALTCGRLLGTCALARVWPSPDTDMTTPRQVIESPGPAYRDPPVVKSCLGSRNVPSTAINGFNEAITNFGFKLYRETVNLAGDEANIIFSPSSIALALGMVTEGADGATLLELERTLSDGHRKLKASQFAELFNQLQTAVFKSGNTNYQLSTANKIYVNESLSLKPDFASALGSCFQSAAELRNFASASEAARAEINQWVEDQTNEKIKDLIPPGGVDSSTLMVLVNAIYFKGEWLKPFKKIITRSFKKYSDSDGDQIKMMDKTETDVPYFEDGNLQAIQLPYTGGDMYMLVLLPRTNTLGAMQQLENQLNAEFIKNMKLRSRYIRVILPKFKLDQSIPLADILKRVGIKKAFTKRANFSKMSTTLLQVTDAFHKAFVAIDKKGTEAAAATAIVMKRRRGGKARPPQPKLFVADHPFVFAIMHKQTSVPLFVGKFAG